MIAAVGGTNVNTDEFSKVLASAHPGETVHLKVVHNGAMRELDVQLGADPDVIYVLKPIEKMTDSQRKIYQGWLGLK